MPGDVAVGQSVELHDLKSKPELNGQVGRVESFVAESGRYVVVLPDGSQLALKPDNLTARNARESEGEACAAEQEAADDALFEQLMVRNAAKAAQKAALKALEAGRELDTGGACFESAAPAATIDIKNQKQELGYGAAKRIKPCRAIGGKQQQPAPGNSKKGFRGKAPKKK